MTNATALGGFTLLLRCELRCGVGTAVLASAAAWVAGWWGRSCSLASRLVRGRLLSGGLFSVRTTACCHGGSGGPGGGRGGWPGAGIAAARLGFESLVQRDVPPAARGTAITRAETTFQLAWVTGAVLPVALPLPLPTTPALVAAAVACLVAASVYTAGLLRLGRRRPTPRNEALR